MTESEWMACSDSAAMLDHVRHAASDRDLRRLACALCRLVWDRMSWDNQAFIALLEECLDDADSLRWLRDEARRHTEKQWRESIESDDRYCEGDPIPKCPEDDFARWAEGHFVPAMLLLPAPIESAYQALRFTHPLLANSIRVAPPVFVRRITERIDPQLFVDMRGDQVDAEYEAWRAATRRARAEATVRQAAVVREVLGNPFKSR
jgi:hypothetical protein